MIPSRIENNGFGKRIVLFVFLLFFVSVSLGFLGGYLGSNFSKLKFFQKDSNIDSVVLGASAPGILTFQGRITDLSETPITTSSNMTFRLYTTSTGGTALWSGSCSVTPDQDGIFDVILGSTCGSAIATSVFAENSEIYLGITVGSDTEMSPRQRIGASAYALNADTLKGFEPSQAPNAGEVVVLDSSGNLVFGVTSPTISSTGNILISPGSTGYVGIGMGVSTPSALLSVGEGSKFSVNSNGDISRIKNLVYSWPTAHPASGQQGFLQSDDGGNLSWVNLPSGSYVWGLDSLSSYTYAQFMEATGVATLSNFGVDNTEKRLWVHGASSKTGFTVYTNFSGSTSWPVVSFKADGSNFTGSILQLVQDGTGTILEGYRGSDIVFQFDNRGDIHLSNNGVAYLEPFTTAPTNTDLFPNSEGCLYSVGTYPALDIYWDPACTGSAAMKLNSSTGSSLWTDGGTFTYLTSTTDDLVLGSSTTSGAKFFFDMANGRLGIGTSTPQASIDIAGAASEISNTNGNITIIPAQNLIVSSGNVGIGTTTPRHLLSVGDASQFNVTATGSINIKNYTHYSGHNTSYTANANQWLKIATFTLSYTFRRNDLVFTIVGGNTYQNAYYGETKIFARVSTNASTTNTPLVYYATTGTSFLSAAKLVQTTSDFPFVYELWIQNLPPQDGRYSITVQAGGAEGYKSEIVIHEDEAFQSTAPTGVAVYDATQIYGFNTDIASFPSSTVKVGIGTSNPAFTLDVNGIIRGEHFLGNQTTSHTTIAANTNTSNGPWVELLGMSNSTRPGELSLGSYGSSGAITFWNFLPGTGHIQLMKILSNGNVGIGVSNPAYKLDVYSSMRVSGPSGSGIEIGQGVTSNNHALIDFVGDTTYTDYGLRIMRENSGANTNSSIRHRGTGTLYIVTEEAGGITFNTSSTSRMTIGAAGNVSIGSPASGSTLSLGRASGASIKSSTNWLIMDSNTNPASINHFTNQNVLLAYGGGNVGIGALNYAYKLDVNGEIASRASNAFRLRGSNYSVMMRNDGTRFYFLLTDKGDPDGSWNAYRPFSFELSNGILNFTQDNGSGNYRSMFYNDYTGANKRNLLIKLGTSATLATSDFYIVFSDNGPGGFHGSISGDGGSGVRYNQTSDARLKTNILPYSGGLETLMKLKTRYYSWKASPENQHIGFIAQELNEVYPYAVSGGPPDGDVKDSPMLVDYSQLTPLLVNATQEQQEIINRLGDKISILETSFNSSNILERIENLEKIYNAEEENYNIANILKLTQSENGDIEILGGKIIFEGDGTLAIRKLKVEEGYGAGKGMILGASTSVVIETTAVSENSKVFVNPTIDTLDKQLYVTDIVSGKSFTVNIREAVESDITFDWFIVDSKQ
ncbi:MAG: tail fiber domain-containing protein [Candidatus Dojkabacteria bacterium]